MEGLAQVTTWAQRRRCRRQPYGGPTGMLVLASKVPGLAFIRDTHNEWCILGWWVLSMYEGQLLKGYWLRALIETQLWPFYTIS